MGHNVTFTVTDACLQVAARHLERIRRAAAACGVDRFSAALDNESPTMAVLSAVATDICDAAYDSDGHVDPDNVPAELRDAAYDALDAICLNRRSSTCRACIDALEELADNELEAAWDDLVATADCWLVVGHGEPVGVWDITARVVGLKVNIDLALTYAWSGPHPATSMTFCANDDMVTIARRSDHGSADQLSAYPLDPVEYEMLRSLWEHALDEFDCGQVLAHLRGTVGVAPDPDLVIVATRAVDVADTSTTSAITAIIDEVRSLWALAEARDAVDLAVELSSVWTERSDIAATAATLRRLAAPVAA